MNNRVASIFETLAEIGPASILDVSRYLNIDDGIVRYHIVKMAKDGHITIAAKRGKGQRVNRYQVSSEARPVVGGRLAVRFLQSIAVDRDDAPMVKFIRRINKQER